MAYTDDEFFTLVADRIEAIEKQLGSEGGQELTRARRAAARERRLLREETLSSENVAAGAADQLMKVHDQISEAQAAFKALVEASNSAQLKKERSAVNSSRLLQEKMSDVEAGIAGAMETLGEITRTIKDADSNATRTLQRVDQAEALIRKTLNDSSVKAELREIAKKDRRDSDEAFVMEVAQKAIRQGLDSGLLQAGPAVQNLKPKPERTADGGD